ncbi:MAG TPA: DNA gyrase inhibitor YacG [Bryobacteraceae bacterium]
MAPATVRCPICKREVPFESPEMPFCSKRCRLLDLGNWASEKYVIPGASGRPDTEDTDASDEPTPLREAKIPNDEPEGSGR